MNIKRKTALLIVAIAMLSFLSSCIVVERGHRHHYWHHGYR